MSFVVAVTVKPSRMQAILKHAMCAMACFVGLFLMCQTNSPLSLWLRATISLSCLFAALFVLRKWLRRRGLCQIKVDADGKIYLHQSDAEDRKVYRGVRVQLLPSSTLWPGVMVLHFRSLDEVAPVISLNILRDSVSLSEFRALSAILRWVAICHGQQNAAGAGCSQ